MQRQTCIAQVIAQIETELPRSRQRWQNCAMGTPRLRVRAM